jgi:hypothetical protein
MKKMTVTKKMIKSDENLMCHSQINLLCHGHLIETYGLTLEELFIWNMEESPEFKYAYWECGRVPRVEVLTNEDWGTNVRARIYFEKPINKNK